jgi:head-tail adaptor
MGIERFYAESIYVYNYSASSTWPYDETWAQITGSPFKGSVTELSGDRAKVGGATESRVDICIDMSTANAVLAKHKIKWDSRNFDVKYIKKLPEKTGHHQEIYCAENKEVVLP